MDGAGQAGRGIASPIISAGHGPSRLQPTRASWAAGGSSCSSRVCRSTHDGYPLDDVAAVLVAQVRASAVRPTSAVRPD